MEKEYLNILNISLGSSGELLSGRIAFKKLSILMEKDFNRFDELHYKVENELISLVKSLQKKQIDGGWSDSFIS